MKSAYLIFFILFSMHISGQAQVPTISFVYDADGNMESRYEVVLKSGDNLKSADASEQEEQNNPAIKDGEHRIVIYPNPTKGDIIVEIIPLNDEMHNFISLYDNAGKLMKTIEIHSERTVVEIIGPPAIYLLNINLGEVISKWKIIKE